MLAIPVVTLIVCQLFFPAFLIGDCVKAHQRKPMDLRLLQPEIMEVTNDRAHLALLMLESRKAKKKKSKSKGQKQQHLRFLKPWPGRVSPGEK